MNADGNEGVRGATDKDHRDPHVSTEFSDAIDTGARLSNALSVPHAGEEPLLESTDVATENHPATPQGSPTTQLRSPSTGDSTRSTPSPQDLSTTIAPRARK